MDRAIFERMAQSDRTHWWFRARSAILDKAIARLGALSPDARILEVGAGTGHNVAMLERHGDVDAVELDAPARAIAAARLGRPVGDSRLPDLAGIDSDAYDLVALLDVLEHVEDDAAALDGIARVLKPGGRLLVTVPAYQWMWSAHDEAHHHHRRYTRAALIRLARTRGYEVAHASYFNSLLFAPIAGVRIANTMLGRSGEDDATPPAPVNRLLETVFGLERHVVGRVPMPFGVSIIAMLELA